MEMVAYFKCLCRIEHRIKANELKAHGYEIRLTDKNKDYKEEVQKLGFRLPFVRENGAYFDAMSGEPL